MQYHFCHVVVPRNSFEEDLAKALQAQGSCTHVYCMQCILRHSVYIRILYALFLFNMLNGHYCSSIDQWGWHWIAGLLLGADEACLLSGSADLCSIWGVAWLGVVYGLQLYFTWGAKAGMWCWNVGKFGFVPIWCSGVQAESDWLNTGRGRLSRVLLIEGKASQCST